MVWYSELLQNFPQFIVIHTLKGFDIVNKAYSDQISNYIKYLAKLFEFSDTESNRSIHHFVSFISCVCPMIVLPVSCNGE